MQFLKKILFGKRQQPDTEYRLDAGDLIYAVGDIHGRLDLLEQLLDIMAADRALRWGVENCTVIFLGDYVDRGFHSKDVVEKLAGLTLDWAEVICLRGNHEDMMLDFTLDPVRSEGWLHFGGLATLASYGVTLQENDLGQPDLVKASNALVEAVPANHMQFLKDAPHHHAAGDYLFVHAGIRPGVALAAQDPYDMTSIRHEFTESKKDFGFKVVHGHTGVQNPQVLSNRVAVDTIAYATGRLTAAVLQDASVEFVST